MSWFSRNFRWFMLVSGVLTCSMLYAAVAPQAALRSTFGESIEGPVAEIVVRNWGALIGLVGVLLIYGAFRPEIRTFVLWIAGASKVIFIGLVLAHGRQFLSHQAGLAVTIDAIVVLLFAAYLTGTAARGNRTALEEER